MPSRPPCPNEQGSMRLAKAAKFRHQYIRKSFLDAPCAGSVTSKQSCVSHPYVGRAARSAVEPWTPKRPAYACRWSDTSMLFIALGTAGRPC